MKIKLILLLLFATNALFAQLWHDFYNPDYYIINSINEIYATHVRLNGTKSPDSPTAGIIFQYDSTTKTITESHMDKKNRNIEGTGVIYTTDALNIRRVLSNKSDGENFNAHKIKSDTSFETLDGYWRIYNEDGLILKDSGSWKTPKGEQIHNVSIFFYSEHNRLDSIRVKWYNEKESEVFKFQNINFEYDENKFNIVKTTSGETSSNWGNVGIEIYQYNENLLLIKKSFKNLYGSELYGYEYEYKFVE